MLKLELLLISCILVCWSVNGSTPKKTTVKLDNGCSLTRYVGNETKAYVAWFAMPLPHLNCSGSGQKRLDVEGVVDDIKGITLSYNDLLELHIDDLEKFKKLEKLEVKSNKLQRIVAPTNASLVLPSVKYLSFTNNQLTEVPTPALKSFPNLTALVLSLNQISTIFDDDFKFNLNLTHIVLGPNPIKTFKTGWMAKLKLRAIVLRGCGLTELPDNFQNQKSMYYADLSDNQITNLPMNAFAGGTNLRWLELASNKMKIIHKDAFKGASQLSVLDLSDNLLETIQPSTFDGISRENLRIDLYENPLNCNCEMAAFKRWSDEMKMNDQSTEIRYKCEQPARNHGKKSNQVTLQDFTCENSDVLWTGECEPPVTTTTSKPLLRPESPKSPTKTCPNKCTCFDENKKMYYPLPGQPKNKQSVKSFWVPNSYPRVDCIDTRYTMIPPQIPSNISMLILDGNSIKYLRLSKLKRFQTVQTLRLKGNNIRTIQADDTAVLPKVKILNLSFNKITLLTKDHLRSFPNLEVISLHHNSIVNVPDDLFGYNNKLQRLYFGPNPISEFNEDFMKTLNLKSISLRNMSLKAVPKSISNLKNVRYIDISDNLITIIPNSTFSKCLGLGRLVMDNNQISTIEANAFNGATSLVSIDLSENLLKTLPATVFSNVSDDRLTVELWENPFSCDCKMKAFKQWIENAEKNDPATEVRFVCSQPLRMHHKKSDQITADDFFCTPHDPLYVSNEEMICKVPSYAGQIALTVFLTFIATMLLCLIAWKCTFKRRYGTLLHYAKQREQMEDMEELQ